MIKEQCTYVCGPYQGYCGKAVYDLDDNLFHGEVIGLRDVVTFQGRSPGELKQAFQDSVDDYLAFCAKRGESPEKPLSGKFIARIDPELHRRISTLADVAGKSLNQFVADCLANVAQTDSLPMPARGSKSTRSVSPTKARRVAKKASSKASTRRGRTA